MVNRFTIIREKLITIKNSIIFIFLSVFILSLISISQQFSLFTTILFTDVLPLENRLTLFTHMYPFITNTQPFYYDFTILILSLLIALDIILIKELYYENKLFQTKSSTSLTSISGIIIAFSIGCVTCGAAAIAGLFALLGSTSIIFLLPFDGFEFLLLGLILLLLAILLHLKILSEPQSCKIKTK